MSTNAPDYLLLQQKRESLLAELRQIQKYQVADEGAIDIHNPKVPQYRYQPFPKMLYHATKLNPIIEEQRKGIKRRNSANPNLPPMEEPHAQPLTRVVASQEDLDIAEKQGFVTAPPFIVGRIAEDEDNVANDPLAATLTKEERKALKNRQVA